MAWCGSFSKMRTPAAPESGAMLIVERNYCMRHARKRLGPSALRQSNRPSLKIPGYSARGFSLTAQPRRKSPAVEVATAEDRHNRPSDGGISHQGGHGGGPCGLHHQLAAEGDELERLDDRRVAHRAYLVDVALNQRQGKWSSVRRRQAIGDGVEPRWHDRMTSGQALAPAGGLLRFHADDPGRRALLLDGDGNARDQTTPADRDDHGANVGYRCQDLAADGALTGRDRRAIERVYQVEITGALLGLQAFLPLRERREDDLRAVAADRVELGDRRVVPDDDNAPGSNHLRRVSERQTVVAGRQGDHPSVTLLGTQLQDGIDGTTNLEGAGPLQVLGLQPNVGTRHPLTRQGRRLHDMGLNPAGRGSDVRQGKQLGLDRHGLDGSGFRAAGDRAAERSRAAAPANGESE